MINKAWQPERVNKLSDYPIIEWVRWLEVGTLNGIIPIIPDGHFWQKPATDKRR